MTTTYIELLPSDIQNLIWNKVENDYRKEHCKKSKQLFDMLPKALLNKCYDDRMDSISQIEDMEERINCLQEFYQWMADNKLIILNIKRNYEEVFLKNPFYKSKSKKMGGGKFVFETISIVSSDEIDEAVRNGNIIEDDENNDPNPEIMDFNICIEVPNRPAHRIRIKIDINDVE